MAAVHRATSQPRAMWPDVTLLVASLAVASAIELVILRTFTRTAIHIPAMHRLQGPYDVVSVTGQYVYFAAVVLAAGAFVALAVQLFRHEVPARYLVLFGIVLFAVPASVAAAQQSDSLALAMGTLAAVLVVCAAVAVTEERRWVILPVAAFGFSFAAGGAYTTIPALTSLGISLEQPVWMLNASEYLGIAFAATTPLLVRGRIDHRSIWLGLAAGVVVLFVFIGSGSTSRFLLLWNIGLSGVLPGFAYAFAAAALTATFVAMIRQQLFLGAAGLALLITGGIGLHSTYQSALVVIGLVALFCGMWLATKDQSSRFASAL